MLWGATPLTSEAVVAELEKVVLSDPPETEQQKRERYYFVLFCGALMCGCIIFGALNTALNLRW